MSKAFVDLTLSRKPNLQVATTDTSNIVTTKVST